MKVERGKTLTQFRGVDMFTSGSSTTADSRGSILALFHQLTSDRLDQEQEDVFTPACTQASQCGRLITISHLYHR